MTNYQGTKKKKLSRKLTNALLLAFSFFLCLVVLEIIYRGQFVDFYKSEFYYFNKYNFSTQGNKKVLVFGDSFTAANNTYLKILNYRKLKYSFINAAISGTGIHEMNVIARKRIKQTKPDLVLVQIYVGNDLLDVQKPINWRTLSIARNLFWLVSDPFYVIRFINYKLGQIKSNFGPPVVSGSLKNNEVFSVDEMNRREKLLLEADPKYYEKSVMLQEDYADRFEKFCNKVQELIQLCNETGLPVKVLAIPASCQVSEYYKSNLEKCGAIFSSDKILQPTYPFVEQLSERFKHAGVEILNPLHYFKKIDSVGSRIYYENDLHLNDRGNVSLANFITLNLETSQHN